MKQKKVSPGFQGDEISGELLTLPGSRNIDLNIRDLAKKLLINRKEALLLLVTLESQGLLIWDVSSKQYRPNPDSLRLLFHGKERVNSKRCGTSQKAPLLAKAA